jgi:hypothetical protein
VIDANEVRPRFRVILMIDAVVNLLLGILLMIFPQNIFVFFGLPVTYEPFYTSVLGAILIGIAVALVIEATRKTGIFTGLGLGGAIAINVCAACAIMLWLVSGRLIMPLRGYLVLWLLIFILLIISGIELIMCDNGIVKKK